MSNLRIANIATILDEAPDNPYRVRAYRYAARRILVDTGMAQGRIRSVTGNSDRDLLVPADPLSPSNRRITVVVLRHAPASIQGVAP